MAKASETMKAPMGPPPPRVPDSNPNPNPSLSAVDAPTSLVSEPDKAAAEDPSGGSTPSESQCSVPYLIPPWSEPSGHPFSLEVLKDGTIVQQLDVSRKGAYMFGRVDLCDFVLEHPTISRFHAVLQFRKDGEAFLYDLGSTHGTFVNKTQVKKKVYTEVHVGDVIRFGRSSRLYLFQGPSELMPPEGDLNKIRSARIREEKLDREASLLRAKAEASLADGISWGMSEDAMEETAENDAEEVTWQTYKGQLTERQEKTRSKIMKRMEKVSNMKKEIDAIRAKDISQGGLTQGQQTQIARNEQRMSQILEELESLEETLNESIQESIGARSRIVRGKKKGNIEEEDDILSDDDEFYDRTKKKPVAQKSSSQPSVETADTLLAKKDSIISEMEEKKAMLNIEEDKLLLNMERNTEKGDDLEAYMSEISSQLVLDKSAMIQKELTNLQTELDRVTYLLKIADPMGEAARQRDVKAHALKSKSIHDITGQPILEQKKSTVTDKPKLDLSAVKIPDSAEEREPPLGYKDACETRENKPTSYSLVKPQWLGAVKDIETKEEHPQVAHVEDAEESDKFVDYKDREKILASVDEVQKLELAAPGLIIRKRKLVEKPIETSDKARKLALPSTAQAETMAADAVALLLKHQRGYSGLDGEGRGDYQETQGEGQLGVENSLPKRVFGPSRPDFLDTDREYESWVPPEGQSGDGRTALNDQLGY